MSAGESGRDWTQALANPLRVQILERLVADRVVSPIDLSQPLGVHRRVVSHHMRQLVRFGVVALGERRAVRGVTQHHYHLTDREETLRALEYVHDLARLSAQDREQIDPKAARGVWSLGAALRTVREARGVSVHDLAHRAGVPQTVVERIEHGEADPRMSLVAHLAGALDLALLDVLREMR